MTFFVGMLINLRAARNRRWALVGDRGCTVVVGALKLMHAAGINNDWTTQLLAPTVLVLEQGKLAGAGAAWTWVPFATSPGTGSFPLRQQMLRQLRKPGLQQSRLRQL